MADQGVQADHSTLNRCVLKYAPKLDQRICSCLQKTNDSWLVGETYIEMVSTLASEYRLVFLTNLL